MAPENKKGPRRGPALFVLLLCLFVWAAPLAAAPEEDPSATPPSSVFQTVAAGKPLRSLPQFFVVDDFNDLEFTNRLGLPWEVEGVPESKGPAGEHPQRSTISRVLTTPVPVVKTVLKTPFRMVKGAVTVWRAEAPIGTLRLRPDRHDSLQKRGGALSLRASLRPSVKITLKSSLENLDMSQAQALVLNCRVRTRTGGDFSGRLELELEDRSGRTASLGITPACRSDAPASWKELVLARSQFPMLDWNRFREIRFLLHSGPEPVTVTVGLDEIAFYGKGDVEFFSEKDNLLGFPSQVTAAERKDRLLRIPESDKLLYEIARDTWRYFENAVDRTSQLPVDHIRVGEPGDVGAYTTPTNLAMYFFACAAARELGFISKKEASARVQKTFETLRGMKRWKGFHYNFYNTNTLQVTRDYVSTVDAGWLAAAWMVLRQAFGGAVAVEAARFLKEIDFSEFYDEGIGQVRLGFDGAQNEYSPYHYGLIATEARVMSFIGIGKRDLPREHWWFIYRTPPAQWTWQNQAPEGKEVEIERVTFFQGHYTYQGRKFVPSWGGSLFEFLMPTLVLKERTLAPHSFGYNNRVATEIQIDYALNRQGYPLWGLSPASTSSGRQTRYGEYGVKYLGVKGYRDEGVISPHASFLALDTLPEQVIDNLRRVLRLYEIYGEYGLYDSVNVRNGRVNTQYLALDQGMILAAIANYLKKGIIQEYFHRDEIARQAESLLGLEKWDT